MVANELSTLIYESLNDMLHKDCICAQTRIRPSEYIVAEQMKLDLEGKTSSDTRVSLIYQNYMILMKQLMGF